jgi:predicted membrane-bound spermidine synthase
MGEWKNGYTIFVFLEILIILILLTVFLGLYISSRISMEGPLAFGLLKTLFVSISSVSGFLVGTEFPLANEEALKHQKGFSRIAGRLYALDLSGAWLGTTLVSVLLVPLIGIPQTLLLAGALKAFGLMYLLMAR